MLCMARSRQNVFSGPSSFFEFSKAAGHNVVNDFGALVKRDTSLFVKNLLQLVK